MTPQGRLARWLPGIALPYGVVLVLLLARQSDVVGLLHDDGVYLSMARSIAAGDGPVDAHMLPDARTARFPPLHPLILAAAGRVVGALGPGLDGVHRLVALNGIWLAVALALFLQWLVRWRGWPPLVALAAGLLVFTLPQVLGTAQHLMSESLFTALLLGVLLAAERAVGNGADEGGRAPQAPMPQAPILKQVLLLGLLAGLLPATRTLGAALVAGLTLEIHRRHRRWRLTALFLGAAALPWGAATGWSLASATISPEVGGSPLFGPPYAALLPESVAELGWILWVNVVRLGDLLLRVVAPGAPLATSAQPWSWIARSAALVGIGLILAFGSRRRPRCPAALPTAAYVALLLPWPFTDPRFLAPIVAPLVLLLGESAAALLPRALGRMPWSRIAAAAGLAAVAALIAWNIPPIVRTFRAARGDLDQAPFFQNALAVAPYRDAAAWLARNTAPTDAFAGTLDPLFHFLSGRPGVSSWTNDDPVLEGYFDRASRWRDLYAGGASRAAMDRMFARAEDVLAEYRRLGVRHVVHVKSGGYRLRELLIDHLVRTNPGTARHFERVHVSPDRAAEIWRFDPRGE